MYIMYISLNTYANTRPLEHPGICKYYIDIHEFYMHIYTILYVYIHTHVKWNSGLPKDSLMNFNQNEYKAALCCNIILEYVECFRDCLLYLASAQVDTLSTKEMHTNRIKQILFVYYVL
jgi:hypothetical protein